MISNHIFYDKVDYGFIRLGSFPRFFLNDIESNLFLGHINKPYFLLVIN